jgi:predicted dehydrogenase
MEKNLKIGIGMVGAGYAAHLRAQAITQLANERIRIAGVYDRDPQHVSQFAAELEVEAYSSLEELCGDERINTISVAVPNRYHYEIVKYGLLRGKNVICEYPLIIDEYERGVELVGLAEERGLLLHVGQTMNYDDDFRLVERYKQELGTLYMGYKYMSFGGKLGSWFELDGFSGDYRGLAGWYIADTLKGGWIVSAHYHGIQHLRRIFGEVVSVSSFNSSSDGVAAASVLMKHEGGASSTVQWAMPIQGKWFNTLIVSGGKGSVLVDSGRFTVHTDRIQEQGTLPGTNPFIEDLKNLLVEVDGKADRRANVEDMLRNLKVALYAEKSAADERELHLDW